LGEQRILIAYFTKGGVTRENAEIIAGILRDDFGHQVDVVDLRTNRRPDIGPYQVVIVGSGIRIGMWYGRPKRFLSRSSPTSGRWRSRPSEGASPRDQRPTSPTLRR
jgi:menaquinone-dependent protoporphyrinogen oxidase